MTDPTLDALPDPIRQALAARGFETLTAVQAAVLDPLNRGRDLRISSQTGSGKTVALGIAAFEAVREALALPLSPGGPTLLVIVPTRELAAQVAEELGWLYGELEGLRIDCVTGGTSVGLERRRLDHPPHVLVGTPGRLLDHLEAGALELSEVAELILDEADQMLDMGFRDELEGILERTPEERRTHLVSATLPAGIVELAEQYQRDARSVEGTALGEANADIEHVAVRVAPQDRYAALTNLLLSAGDERTLVFVATRAGAAQLADRLADDGFAALPLSGELAQAQRTRTLTAFRSGVARILVATDVAARGIDVPDVGCVIHASVPLDAEVYTHRSGRTGRAGRKGRSVLLVTPRQERKANFQFRDLGIDAEWRPAPDALEVEQVLRARRRARLEALVSEAGEPDPQRAEEARNLLGERDPVAVLAAVLATVEDPSGPQPLALEQAGGDRGRPREDRPRRERENARGPAAPERRVGRPGSAAPVRFQINWGFDGGATPKRILAHICRRGEISGGDVGAIHIRPRSSTFELLPEVVTDFEARMAVPDERDPQIRIRRAWTDGPDARRRPSGGGEGRYGRRERGPDPRSRSGGGFHGGGQHGGRYGGGQRRGGQYGGGSRGGQYGGGSHGSGRVPFERGPHPGPDAQRSGERESGGDESRRERPEGGGRRPFERRQRGHFRGR